MKITFLACLKQTGKPIKFGSDGSAEIVLEMACTEAAQIATLLTVAEQTLKVTIEEE